MTILLQNKIPEFSAQEKIALFGGSFNPPHEGHLFVARQIFKYIEIDKLWWLVSPGNPLKDNHNLLPIAKRLQLSLDLIKAQEFAHKVIVTAFEQNFNYIENNKNYSSYETINYLIKHCETKANFVFIIGADCLNNFHHWYKWQELVNLLPIIVVQRPKFNYAVNDSEFSKIYGKNRIKMHEAKNIALLAPPIWCYIDDAGLDISSTELRSAKNKDIKL